jgi:hypothetical protein
VIDFGGRVLRNVRVEEISFEMIPKEEAGKLLMVMIDDVMMDD